jgi:predicted dehydrogenase
VRIGLIGYGGIGRVHALAYRTLGFHYGLPADSITVHGVATTRKESAERAAGEIGCSIAVSDYHELLQDPGIDAVDICVPNHLHEEVVVAAAQAGKHIYCEKPLAMDPAGGRRMVEAAESAGVTHQVGFNFRYYPAVLRARELIREGFLGKPFSFHGRYFRSSYIDPTKPLSWRLRKETARSGALFDLGSHIIDLSYFLLGDFRAVKATTRTLIAERPLARDTAETGPVDVDDLALLSVETASGTIGSIEVSRMGTGLPNDLRIEIFGSSGAIRFSAQDPSWLEVYDVTDKATPRGGMRGFRRLETVQRYEGQRAPDWSMPPGFIRTNAESQYTFVQACRSGAGAEPSMRHALHVQEVMESALASQDSGDWEPVAATGPTPSSRG